MIFLTFLKFCLKKLYLQNLPKKTLPKQKNISNSRLLYQLKTTFIFVWNFFLCCPIGVTQSNFSLFGPAWRSDRDRVHTPLHTNIYICYKLSCMYYVQCVVCTHVPLFMTSLGVLSQYARVNVRMVYSFTNESPKLFV